MKHIAISIRPFIGAKDFELSRAFMATGALRKVSLIAVCLISELKQLGFIYKKAYVRGWVDNTMVFLEVKDLNLYWKELLALDLTAKYQRYKASPHLAIRMG